MASRKSFLAKPSCIFAETSETHFNPKPSEGVLELDEAEVWNLSSNANNNPATEAKKALSGLKRGSRKVDSGGKVTPVAPASLPVNIPDWSKILKDEYKEHKKWDSDDEDVDEEGHGGRVRVPPHEYLARTRGASLSVHEGIGRTLKGRDLRSVRNAIWKQVGFED